jgi:hypothetical protein
MPSSPAITADIQEAVFRSPYRFPAPAGEWSATDASAFEADLQKVLGEAGVTVPAEALPATRYARLVASLANLPRFGRHALAAWVAGLVNDIHATQPALVGSGTYWSYPTRLTGSMLCTLLAMRIHAEPTALSPKACKALLTSLRQDQLNNVHADLRQDGRPGGLLWLDDLCRKADTAPGTKKRGASVLDTAWSHNMTLDRVMEHLGEASVRGEGMRELVSRLAVRAAEDGAPSYMSAKPGNKISDESWRLRPFKLLAQSIVKSANDSNGAYVADLEPMLRNLASISGVEPTMGATSFHHDFCYAVSDAARSTSWGSHSRRLLGPAVQAGRTNVIMAVIECLRSMDRLEYGFLRALRNSYFERRPDDQAGAVVESYLTECAMQQVIKSRDVAPPAAAAPPATRPARRRASI